MERVTLFEALQMSGYHEDQINPDGYVCPTCNTVSPAWAMNAPVPLENEEVVLADIRCTNCTIDLERQAIFEAEQLEKARLEVEEPWNTDEGIALKIERNRRINEAMWAVDENTSPLAEAAKEEWRTYVSQLHRITVDYTCPADVVWPVEPAITYP